MEFDTIRLGALENYKPYTLSRIPLFETCQRTYTGWPKKVSHYQIIKKMC